MKYGNPSKKAKVVTSLKGHSIEFPGRGSVPAKSASAHQSVDADGVVYVYVPPAVRVEVAAAGMQPETEFEEPAEKVVSAKPEGEDELRKQVYETFKMLVELADRESFAGTGVPKSQAVEKLLGYAITNTELKNLWNRFLLDSKEGVV